MANQTLTTGTPSVRINFDSTTLAGLSNGDTITIDGGHLLIDGDNRWGSNAAVFDTISNSATLGGTVRFDATQTWEVPFSASTGNVPTVADAGSNAITGTGITGELLRVWATGSLTPSAAGGSMPTTGLVKLRSKTGTFSNGLVVTLPGGATITCSGAGKRSWIHVVGEEVGSLNITRLGNATARGDYYDLGTTNGSDDQTFQFPVADACPVIFVETSAGSGVYEEWLNAGDRWGTATQFVSTDVRGKYFGQVNSTGVITIARRATNSCGYKPATGCKVRIPNIIMSSSTSADWNANTINTTVASRYETITTSAGVIDLENVSCNWYINTSSAYSVSLKYSGFLQVVNITNTATTNTLVDVGVGLNAAQVSQAITIGNSSNSSTLTNVRAARYSATGANQYTLQIIDSNNVTLTDVQGEMFGDTTTVARNNANVSAINMTRCLGVVSDRFTAIGGRIQLVTCADVTFNDTRYADIINGTTTTIQAISAIDLSQSGSNNRFNGFSYFGGLTDVHPYSNTFLLATGMEGTIIENIGTADSPISLGSTNATGTLISANASYNSIVRRCYCVNTRTQPLIFANSTDGTIIDNVWGDEADTSVISGNNLTARGCRWINTTTGQNAVYGRHWEDAFTSTTAGRLVISCNEPTATTADQCAITAGTPKFTSTGNVSMPTIGDQVTWTMPYYMIGVTSLANIAPTLTGTNTGNFTMEFQWDTGNGFSAWTVLTGANLAAVGAITPATGVKLKVRATTASASSTNALTCIRIDTVTNSTDRKLQYALPTDAVATISGIIVNSRVIVHNETDDILLYDAICPTTTLTIPYYNGVSAGVGDAIKVYALFYNTTDGSTASQKTTALATATATGFAVHLDMQMCTVYGEYFTTYGTTGAATYASGDFVRDQSNVQIDLDDSDNTWHGHRLFMFDKYDLYINAGRRESFSRVSAPDAGNINLGGIYLDNINTTTAKQGDNINLYNDDGILPVENPTTGGGGITMYSGGKILTTTTGGIAPSETQIKEWVRAELVEIAKEATSQTIKNGVIGMTGLVA